MRPPKVVKWQLKSARLWLAATARPEAPPSIYSPTTQPCMIPWLPLLAAAAVAALTATRPRPMSTEQAHPRWESMWAAGLGPKEKFDVGAPSGVLLGHLKRSAPPAAGATAALVPGAGRAYDALALADFGYVTRDCAAAATTGVLLPVVC